MQISELEFRLLRRYLVESCGIDVPWEKRYLFETRLQELLEQHRCRSFAEFHRELTSSKRSELEGALVEAMTTNETSFFRDGHPFEALRNEVLPAIAEHKLGGTVPLSRRLRLWSAGCSTGEEVYSLAITVASWIEEHPDFDIRDVQVLGVDVSRAVLDYARIGVYDASAVEERVDDLTRRKWFEPHPRGYRVNEKLRGMVTFAEANLRDPFEGLGFFDVIFCRNVIIYFEPALRRTIVERFHRMLNPGGVLCLGASETLYHVSKEFRPVHVGPSIFYEKR